MFVYKITNNLNQKCYIGYDSGPVEENRRWKDHQREWKHDRKDRNPKRLYLAIRKHGIENFRYEVLCLCETLAETKQKEKEWIAYYDSTQQGYNATLGGDGSQLSLLDPEIQKRVLEQRSLTTSRENQKRWAAASLTDRKEHADKVRARITPRERESRSRRAISQWSNPIEAKKKRDGMSQRAQNPYRIATAIANLMKIDNTKHYLIIDPCGKEYEVKGLKKFCLEHNLIPQAMSQVARGKNKHHKGWKCSKKL